MSQNEDMEKLANAMGKLADTLDKFQDPILWQKVISDAMQAIPGLHPQIYQLMAPPQQLGEGPSLPISLEGALPISLEGVSVSLSDEERHRLANQVYEAMTPQLNEFNNFVQESLKEMPAHRLRKLAEKIEAGEKPQFKRRRGCVFISAGEDEFYLSL